MAEHPIQGLMKTAMENLKEMIDVNTIIGDPVETPDGSVIPRKWNIHVRCVLEERLLKAGITSYSGWLSKQKS